ncbi:MAG: hypothetical protein KJ804_05780 [Proteobacteria bacterium]|nr:hypothetical protein [Pseudomonadota bacterium]MBU1057812.1 hypothetical protein [Pseudomonadota bacterium]
MKDKYDSNLEIKILTTDSEEAKSYNFRSSTNVLFNDELIPLDIATDREKLDLFLSENL